MDQGPKSPLGCRWTWNAPTTWGTLRAVHTRCDPFFASLITLMSVLPACRAESSDILPEGPTGLTSLIDTRAWQPVSVGNDPLANERPPEVHCDLGRGYLHEESGFDVNTGSCNYGMFSQRSLARIYRGARIKVYLYHFDLVSSEPAEAHVAVLAGERTLWEASVPIPSKANAYDLEFKADFSAAPGMPLYFHVHNHGQNNWTLMKMEVQVPAEEL